MKKIFVTFAAAALVTMSTGSALAGWFGGTDTAAGGLGWGIDLASGSTVQTSCPYGCAQDGSGAGPGDGTQPRPLDGTGFGSPWTR